MDDYENFTERMTSFDLTLTGDESQDPELIHYGVKGMKWGVRKDERTAARTARRESRAQKYLTKAEGYSSKADSVRRVSDRTKLLQKRDQALKDAEAKRQGKLTTTQKRVVIGAAVVATLIAAKVTYNTIDSGAARVMVEDGKKWLTKNKTEFDPIADRFKRDESLARKMGIDELENSVIKHINPGYGAPGTKMNCRRATMAYEMRRRGYDVQATRSTQGTGQNMFGMYNAVGPTRQDRMKSGRMMLDLFNPNAEKRKQALANTEILKKHIVDIPEVKPKNTNNGSHIYDTLRTQPNGARGELAIKWNMGGRHSVAWEIVDNKPVIFDTQTGETYKNSLAFSLLGTRLSEASIQRLDDLPLNQEYLRRWVKNV